MAAKRNKRGETQQQERRRLDMQRGLVTAKQRRTGSSTSVPFSGGSVKKSGGSVRKKRSK